MNIDACPGARTPHPCPANLRAALGCAPIKVCVNGVGFRPRSRPQGATTTGKVERLDDFDLPFRLVLARTGQGAPADRRTRIVEAGDRIDARPRRVPLPGGAICEGAIAEGARDRILLCQGRGCSLGVSRRRRQHKQRRGQKDEGGAPAGARGSRKQERAPLRRRQADARMRAGRGRSGEAGRPVVWKRPDVRRRMVRARLDLDRVKRPDQCHGFWQGRSLEAYRLRRHVGMTGVLIAVVGGVGR